MALGSHPILCSFSRCTHTEGQNKTTVSLLHEHKNGRKKYTHTTRTLFSRLWISNVRFAGTAVHECVCDDALVHLKSYKYSSVDKSLISRYILKHYVRPKHLTITENFSKLIYELVEWLRGAIAPMACTKYGHPARLLLHLSQRDPA